MIVYELIGKYYDEIVGDQKEASMQVKELIEMYAPGSKSLLELACGTGSYLFHLSKYFEVTAGLDISSLMLSIARNKLPGTPLYLVDMTEFSFDRKFDVIICMSDSINHLLDLDDWKKVFSSAAAHLNEEGLFIFDINTEYRLEKLSEDDCDVYEFGENFLITDVRSAGNGIYEWHLRILENKKEHIYELYEEILQERAFPEKVIRDALSQHFDKIRVVDLEKESVTQLSERLHFIALKK